MKTIPTVGFNLEEITVQGIKLTIWDCGGQEKVGASKRSLAGTAPALQGQTPVARRVCVAVLVCFEVKLQLLLLLLLLRSPVRARQSATDPSPLSPE